MISYVASTSLTSYASANYVSVIGSVSPMCAIMFWYLFPSLNSWASGTNYPIDSMDGLMNLIALPFALLGIYLFRKYETASHEPDSTEVNHGPIELFC